MMAGLTWPRMPNILIYLLAPQPSRTPRSATRSGGLQVLFGVDYALTDAVSLGFKGRYVMFDSFTGDLVWDPLRSHAP